MVKKIINLIEKYDSIIIARHKNPDLDAYGSQFGFYYALKSKYPHKTFYIVGDSNNQNYFGDFDEIDIEIRKNSLVFILDTVASQMLRKVDHQYYDKLILIDHHRNDPDIEYDLYLKDIDASSTAEMIAYLLSEAKIEINHDSARALYMGILGDTGRFRYNNTTAKTFAIVSELLKKGINLQDIHNQIYLETFDDKKIKSAFFNSVKITERFVAYRKNTKEFLEEYSLTSNYVSRGLLGQMAGIKEIPIWVNFTYNPDEENIKCEIRSRNYDVLKVAKSYGGGGHLHACGCSLDTWEETDLVLQDLDRLIEEE